MSDGKPMSDNATKHAMARRLQELLGIAQAESIVAGIKLQAAQQVGHHALAALHADERMWDAVVKTLTPKEAAQQAPAQPQQSASTTQKAPASPVATLEDIRATLVLHGQRNIAQMIEGEIVGSEGLLDAAQVIEATPWESGVKAATMAEVARLLREMVKAKAIPAPKRDWMDSGGSGDRSEKPPATPIPGSGRIDKSRGG